jgi:hypothetical protein
VTALSNMAAAARPPGTGDARVPCPLCGGLIHPVAGRCKHCKADLSALRAGRPQAAAVLPPLNGKPPAGQVHAHVQVPGHVAGHGTSVHAAAPAAPSPYAPAGAPIAVKANEGSAPILPQRMSSQHNMPAQSRGLLRNWPVLVIILAVLAIVTAVVIMVLPADRKNGGKRQLMPAPAPERMETMPDKSSQADPWAQPGGPNSGARPPTGILPDPQPRVTPDPPAAPDPNDIDPNDLYGSLSQGGGAVFLAIATQACKKMKTCSTVNQSMLKDACDQLASLPLPSVPMTCDAAKACMDAIDHMDCDLMSSSSNPLNMMALMKDCTRAATEC